MDDFDRMITHHADRVAANVETAIKDAITRADSIGCGVRVERWDNTTVVIVSDTVPQGTIDNVRIDARYDVKDYRP